MVSSVWLENLTDGYSPDIIYNAHETELFVKCLPDKSLAFNDEAYNGRKNSKDSPTVLLGANSTGTVKLEPLVIGKVESLPTDYIANKKSWMNAVLCLVSGFKESTRRRRKRRPRVSL